MSTVPKQPQLNMVGADGVDRWTTEECLNGSRQLLLIQHRDRLILFSQRALVELEWPPPPKIATAIS